jgi:hypothetical protein
VDGSIITNYSPRGSVYEMYCNRKHLILEFEGHRNTQANKESPTSTI